MRTIMLVCLLLISSATFAQEKPCTLWLGDESGSMDAVKQVAEKYLEIKTQIVPNEAVVKTVYEMKDGNELLYIKIWLKPKKVLKDGAMTTIYTISSYKITSLVDNIDVLYKALQEKVAHCTTEANAETTLFGINNMFIEKKGSEHTKKNLPMATITVTAK